MLDIETSPSVVYTFDYWNASIGAEKVIEPSHMMCWAAKWYGEKKVFFRSTYHDDKPTMVSEIRKLMDEAGIVIHFNGKRFDIPHLNREILEMGLKPPSPCKQIDLYQTVRRVFRFTHSGLGPVCQRLGLRTKLPHSGFQLWKDALNGDKDAWAEMRAYNIQDVEIMEPLYEKLRPWIPGHPSFAAFTGADCCPACGSAGLIKEGFTITSTGRFQRYRCRDCGRWSRSTRRAAGTGIVAVAG